MDGGVVVEGAYLGPVSRLANRELVKTPSPSPPPSPESSTDEEAARRVGLDLAALDMSCEEGLNVTARGSSMVEMARAGAKAAAAASDCKMVDEAGAGDKAKAAGGSNCTLVDEAEEADKAKAAAGSDCTLVDEAEEAAKAAAVAAAARCCKTVAGARKMKTKVVKIGKDDPLVRALLEMREMPGRPPYVVRDGVRSPRVRAALEDAAAALKAYRERNELILEQCDRLGYAYVETIDEEEEEEYDPIMAFVEDYNAGKICRSV